jgi:protein subunit release factor A
VKTQKQHKEEPLLTLTKKDFRVDKFRSGGKGGQHQNKVESGVRITHIESGISAESRSDRSQHRNKQIAFRRLCDKPEFKNWLRVESLHAEEIKCKVEESMKPENLKIEIFKDGGWANE